MIGNGNNETNFLHKLLLTNWQVSADKFQVSIDKSLWRFCKQFISSYKIIKKKKEKRNKQTNKQKHVSKTI